MRLTDSAIRFLKARTQETVGDRAAQILRDWYFVHSLVPAKGHPGVEVTLRKDLPPRQCVVSQAGLNLAHAAEDEALWKRATIDLDESTGEWRLSLSQPDTAEPTDKAVPAVEKPESSGNLELTSAL